MIRCTTVIVDIVEVLMRWMMWSRMMMVRRMMTRWRILVMIRSSFILMVIMMRWIFMMWRVRRMRMMMVLTWWRSNVWRMMLIMMIWSWGQIIVFHAGTSFVVSSSFFWWSRPGSWSSVIMNIVVVMMLLSFWTWTLSDRCSDTTFSHWTSR